MDLNAALGAPRLLHHGVSGPEGHDASVAAESDSRSKADVPGFKSSHLPSSRTAVVRARARDAPQSCPECPAHTLSPALESHSHDPPRVSNTRRTGEPAARLSGSLRRNLQAAFAQTRRTAPRSQGVATQRGHPTATRADVRLSSACQAIALPRDSKRLLGGKLGGVLTSAFSATHRPPPPPHTNAFPTNITHHYTHPSTRTLPPHPPDPKGAVTDSTPTGSLHGYVWVCFVIVVMMGYVWIVCISAQRPLLATTEPLASGNLRWALPEVSGTSAIDSTCLDPGPI